MIGKRARNFANQLHEGQTRPNGIPYTEHINDVGDTVIEFGVLDPSTVAAAYLHDSVEDQAEKLAPSIDKQLQREAALTVIKSMFGERTAELVNRLSNPEETYDTEDEKIAAYIDHVRRDILSDPDAIIIKIADVFSNAGTVLDLPEKRHAKAYKKYHPVLTDLLEALNTEELRNKIEDKARLKIQLRGRAILQLLETVNRA